MVANLHDLATCVRIMPASGSQGVLATFSEHKIVSRNWFLEVLQLLLEVWVLSCTCQQFVSRLLMQHTPFRAFRRCAMRCNIFGSVSIKSFHARYHPAA